jgi:hypothetical protein
MSVIAVRTRARKDRMEKRETVMTPLLVTAEA